jgi:hypothetical protein
LSQVVITTWLFVATIPRIKTGVAFGSFFSVWYVFITTVFNSWTFRNFIMENTTLLKPCAGFVLIAVIGFFSCTKTYPDGMDRSVYTLSDRPVGANEEIPTGGPTARFEGSYDAGKNTLQYTITWNALSSNVQSLHFHGPGTGGNPEGVHTLPITVGGSSGSSSGSIVISEAEEAELLTHKWRYDIHTASQPAGEIVKPIYASPY